MGTYQDVYQALDSMEISFDVVEHPPALTTEDADRFIEGKQGVRTKSLLLNNRKKSRYYLVIMDDSKRLDMEKLSNILGENRISFTSPARLMEKMRLSPGVVSIFGLLNNPEQDISVYFDRAMVSEPVMTFHPNDNTKTLFIATGDMYKFVSQLGYSYTIVNL